MGTIGVNGFCLNQLIQTIPKSNLKSIRFGQGRCH
jgi:hypothetical protein